MTQALQGRTFHNGRTFDRIPRFDPRSIDFKISSHLVVPAHPPKTKTRARHTFLNQGTEGGCTGFSHATLLSFAPHFDTNITSGNAEWLYGQAKFYDEFPGENYEGSSVLGSMKAGKADGLLADYLWATTLDEIIHALAFKGPVNLGINWYNNMFNPDHEGIIRVGGTLAGGHAICASSYKTAADGSYLIRLDNTWGPGWAQKGSAWISDTDLSRLLSEQGEAACPTKAYPLPALQSAGRQDSDSPSGGVTGSGINKRSKT